jgi:hypothetical protein
MLAAANGASLIGLINEEKQIQPGYRYRVALAEALAGGGTFYLSPGDAAHPEVREISLAYARFAREHGEWLAPSRCEADCAVLYSVRNQAFLQGARKQKGSAKLHDAQDRFRQVADRLTRRRVSYECLVLEKGLTADRLASFPVVIAPGIELLADDEATLLRQYVQRGGRLCVQGELGTCKEVRGQYVARRPTLLQELTDSAGDPPDPEHLEHDRIVCVARAIDDSGRIGVTPHPDLNGAVEAIGQASRLSVRCDFPVEATVNMSESVRSIHLIRLGEVEAEAHSAVQIRYQLPVQRRVRDVKVVSPELTADQLGASWRESAGVLEVGLDRMAHFALIGVRLEPSLQD